MTNEQLQKYLARFPGDCTIELQMGAVTAPIERIEIAALPAPTVVSESNIGWADLLREQLKLRLIAGAVTPPIEAVTERTLKL